jgi:hypothetical protein
MANIKQTQYEIDKFVKELDKINKDYEWLFNWKLTLDNKSEYEKVYKEFSDKINEIFDKFKQNKY